MLLSTMFPGNFMGLNLMAGGPHQTPLPQAPPNSAPISAHHPSISNAFATLANSYQNRAAGPPLPQSAAAVSTPSPGLFPAPRPPTMADFGNQTTPFWSPQFQFPNLFGVPPAPAVLSQLSKNGIGMNGQVDWTNFIMNKSQPFFRPAIPPYLPTPQAQLQSAFQPSCVPKPSAGIVDAPPPKRICSADRIPTSSPYCSTAYMSAPCSSISVMAGGDPCPICRQKLPRTSSPQELKRHIMDDTQETEKQFLQLKRKLTAGCIGAAATASAGLLSSVSPDPAFKSRLDTYQRVRENRITRMREKLTSVQLSHSSGSPVNRKIFGMNEFSNRQQKEESSPSSNGRQSTMASSSSRSSSTTPRSTAPFRSPAVDQEIAKTSTPASSKSISPVNVAASATASAIHTCTVCHGPVDSVKILKRCRHILCGKCWDRAVGETVENPVCPICVMPVSSQDILQMST